MAERKKNLSAADSVDTLQVYGMQLFEITLNIVKN